MHVFSVTRHVMSWNPFTASHSNGKEMNRMRKALMKYLLSLRCTHLVDLLYWKSRSSFCQPNCHDSFALLFFPHHLQITITQFGILETLEPTEFQREQTSSCFLFLSGWTIGLLLCKPWHTRTFPKQTIICLFCGAFLIQHRRYFTLICLSGRSFFSTSQICNKQPFFSCRCYSKLIFLAF